MKQTVVGVFDRYAEAQHAAQQLRESGFGDSVYVTDDPEVATQATERDTGVLASVRNFFSNLFGDDDEREVSPYAEAVRRGGAIVKVEVEEEERVDTARRALEAAGAVDIDERANEWRASGWDEGSSLRGGSTYSGSDAGLAASGGAAGLAAGEAGTMGSSERTSLSGTASMSDTEYVPPAGLASGTETPTGGSATAYDVDPLTGRDTGSGEHTGLRTSRDPSTGSMGTDDSLGTSSSMGATARAATGAQRESDVIPVVREELQIGKRLVSTGGVRVYARTVEEPVRESLELRSEHAEVERRPVDRPASAADLEGIGERTIEVREMAEQPVVAKEARVVEEVVVGKTVETRTEQIEDTVRHTEVDVENLEGGGTRSAGMASAGAFDESYYRNHWQSNFADQGGAWEDYEPAYRYGDTMRGDARWSGRSWDEAEPGLRSEWETRHPGSAWERFKASVRHAWERMTT